MVQIINFCPKKYTLFLNRSRISQEYITMVHFVVAYRLNCLAKGLKRDDTIRRVSVLISPIFHLLWSVADRHSSDDAEWHRVSVTD